MDVWDLNIIGFSDDFEESYLAGNIYNCDGYKIDYTYEN